MAVEINKANASPGSGHSSGKVVQVIGPVVDIEFPPHQLPRLLNAVELQGKDGGAPTIVEVEQHLGNNWVRCVAMDSTDGLRRGTVATDTGSPISVPAGRAGRGRSQFEFSSLLPSPLPLSVRPSLLPFFHPLPSPPRQR